MRTSMPIAECWRALSNAFLASYQPELHYMRGPGPKWHEKRTRDAACTVGTASRSEMPESSSGSRAGYVGSAARQ